MKTKATKEAEQFAARIAAAENERRSEIARRRDDHIEARDALKAKREETLSHIDEVAAAQKASTKAMFAELIASEDRRVMACEQELRSMEADEAEAEPLPSQKTKPNLKVAGGQQ